MKKIILFLILTVSISGLAFGAEASSNTAAKAGQINQIWRQNRRWNRNRNNNNSVRYETRIEHKGNKVYRDTYRITWKNGKEHVKRVSRVRIR